VSSVVVVCVQDFKSLSTYLSQCTSTSFLDIVSDFHLLLFLVTNEVMPLGVGPLSAPCWEPEVSPLSSQED